MKKIRVGLIGLGTMGKIYLEHLSNELKSEVEIGGVCDIDIDETLLKNHSISFVTEDYKKILNHKDIEVVLITSPAQAQATLLIDALQSKKKIFCERPISIGLETFRKLLTFIEKENSFLQIGSHRRFDNNYQTLQKKCKDLGTIRSIHIMSRYPATLTREYIQNKGNIFMSATAHDFDLVHFLTNQEIKSMYVKGLNRGKNSIDLTSDNLIINIQLSQKTLCTIINSYHCCYGYDQRVEVFGDKGMNYMDNHYSDTVFFLGKEGLKKQNFYQNFIGLDKKPYGEEMKNLISNIRENKSFRLKDELKVITASLMAKKSFDEKRVVYFQEIQKEMKNLFC